MRLSPIVQTGGIGGSRNRHKILPILKFSEDLGISTLLQRATISLAWAGLELTSIRISMFRHINIREPSCNLQSCVSKKSIPSMPPSVVSATGNYWKNFSSLSSNSCAISPYTLAFLRCIPSLSVQEITFYQVAIYYRPGCAGVNCYNTVQSFN